MQARCKRLCRWSTLKQSQQRAPAGRRSAAVPHPHSSRSRSVRLRACSSSRPGVWRQPGAHAPLCTGGAARGRGRHASRWRRCRADLGSRVRSHGRGERARGLAGEPPGRGRSRRSLGRDHWAGARRVPGRACGFAHVELASTEARRLLTAGGGLDRVGPDSRLPTEGLGMSGSAVAFARPGGRRGVGGRAWAAGGAGAGPGERHRAYKLDQHRDRRRWRSETLLSDVCTRHRSRRRTERSEG
jgi:hypothetical protein